MQAKPAVKPRPLAEDPAQPASPARTPAVDPVVAPRAAPAAAAADDDDLELDFTGIQLAEETDPLQAVIEQAAIAYANENDDEALSVLTEAVRVPDRSPTAERIWLMLFDLCQVTGNREAFAEIELEFAQRFEKQPPVWTEAATAAAVTAAVGAAVVFKGDLVGDNTTGFNLAQQAFDKATARFRLDLSRVKTIDEAGCQSLLDLLARARKLKREVELLGMDTVGALLEPKIAGEDKAQSYWQLLLEILQRQGRQEDFDNVALSFAITFEISPPSFELAPSKAAEKPAKTAVKAHLVRPDDAFYLEGEILGGKVDGLEGWFGEREKVIIDLAGVTRMDFTSAGAMLNIMMPYWQRGTSITLRHPNRLVAELLAVVGVGEVASVVFARK